MEKQTFKTNLKCGGCVAAVKPYMDQLVGADNWNVDLEKPEKTLEVNTEVKEDEVSAAFEKAGYKAEKV